MENIVEKNDKNQTEASNQTMLKSAAITSVNIFHVNSISRTFFFFFFTFFLLVLLFPSIKFINSSKVKSDLNIGAKPFHPVLQVDSKQNKCLKLKIPLDSDIWKYISARSPPSCQESNSISKPQKFVGAPIKIASTFNPRPTPHRFSLNISSDSLIHIFRSDNIQ